MIQFSCRFAF